MRYLNTKKKRTYWRELGIALFVLFIFFLYMFLPKLIIGSTSIVSQISTPLFKVFSHQGVNDSWAILFSKKESLLEENRLLAERLSFLEGKALLSDLLLVENNTLKGLKADKLTASSTPLLAPIIGRAGLSLYSTVIVGLGTEDGVIGGNFVLSPAGYLIGTVSRVDVHTALVTLFSADGLERDVFVGTGHTLLKAEGQGSGNFIIETPHEAGIIIGDAIINADGLPYPFGVVEEIKSKSAEPFETIRFQHPVNVPDLPFVLIVPYL